MSCRSWSWPSSSVSFFIYLPIKIKKQVFKHFSPYKNLLPQAYGHILNFTFFQRKKENPKGCWTPWQPDQGHGSADKRSEAAYCKREISYLKRWSTIGGLSATGWSCFAPRTFTTVEVALKASPDPTTNGLVLFRLSKIVNLDNALNDALDTRNFSES